MATALVGLGAHHVDVGQGPDDAHVVLADPEGNEFCIIEPANSFLADCGLVGSITCDGTPQVGHFWSEVLGWPLVWDQDDETAIRAPDGTGPFITWGRPRPPKVAKNRLHLDIAPLDDTDQGAEVDRLAALGAAPVGIGQGDVSWVVMTDPADQPLILDETTVALHNGELEETSWVDAWIDDTDPPGVVYVGVTGLPPVVRAWLHVHDDDPDIGRVRAEHPELLLGNVTVRAFRIRPDLNRQEVKAMVLSQLAEPTTPPEDAAPEQRCAHDIAAVLGNGLG